MQSPRQAHFADFAVAGAEGPVLPDTYQAERHRAHEAQGWPGGRGPASGDTVFTANTLVLDVTYLHAPLVPGMGALLRALGRAAPAGLAGDGMRRAGLLPMTVRVSLPMQTPAREGIAGAVIRPRPGVPDGTPPRPPGAGGDALACAGLWCTPARAGGTGGAPPTPPGGSTGGSPGSSAGGSPGLPPTSPSPSPAPTPTLPPDAGPGLPGTEDGCGVILCCTAGTALPA